MVAIEDRMRKVLSIPGVRRVGLVRVSEGHEIAVAGGGAAAPAPEAAALLRAARGIPGYTGTGIEQLVVTGREHHLLVAPLDDGDLCVQVRMARSEGHLGLAMRLLRELASAPAPPSPRRRRTACDRTPESRVRVMDDRSVLERVLNGLRELNADVPPVQEAVAP
ncbi:hypothetical protein [Nocardiopsis suaedae]|uniref:Roadblock/LAMTOR2 domain-containing protein n=1 Tax=Nocardiopsis suaedae TaxID=3018444 RepID=A0ABT4TJ32_9ACTN|nr:hypothetical protein [Nocardiopsis suaedae]MDA2804601.1 hypothetical protein [Nocardiopsis suaedae]